MIIRVGAEWVNYHANSSCKQVILDYRDDHAKLFCAMMKIAGHKAVTNDSDSINNPDKVFCWGNDNAWESDFRHPDFGGDSLNWADNVHFLFYSNHGGNSGSTMRICFSKPHNNCRSFTSQWKLGDKMLKWLVLDCCDCVLNTSTSHLSTVWFPPAHGIHMIFGFVGEGTDGADNSFLGFIFGAEAAVGSKLSNAWLDVASASYDDVAIAMAYGKTKEEAINRRENETINWRDYDVESANWLAWKWRG